MLVLVSIFTSFYAGLNTIFEIDLKKLIALSTLSHLGFICIAFRSGLLHLRFFHLLVHALFKSLLFITIGDIMINLNHSQDIRYLSKGSIYTPFSSILIRISIFNLVGIPNIRGYFSKDLVLETMNYRNSSIFVICIMYLNVGFTYYYSYKLFFFTFQSCKVSPYQLFHAPYTIHRILIVLLRGLTLVFSTLFMEHIFSFVVFYFIAPSIKFIPLALNASAFLYLTVFLVLPTVKSKKPFAFFSTILFLSNVIMTFSSNLYFNYLFNSVKSFEIGFMNYSLNFMPRMYINSVQSIVFSSIFKIQNTSFLFSITFIRFIIFCLMF